jgi:hypothetical protein
MAEHITTTTATTTTTTVGQMFRDIFASVPARAVSLESGMVSPLPQSAARIDISFRKHFDVAATPPRVVAWAVLRERRAAGLSPAVRVRPDCIVASQRSATITVSDFAEYPRAQLFWFAFSLPKANPALSAMVLRVASSSPSSPLSITPAFLAELSALIATTPIDEVDVSGQTLLHAAACNGYLFLVHWLLRKGASVDAVDEQSWTPFLAALAAEQAATALALLEHGASLLATCERGMTALHILCRWKQFSESQASLAKLLVARGVGPNERNDAGETPLLYLIKRKPDCVQFARVLLELGANPRVADLMGMAPLHVAAALDSTDLAQLLIRHGADSKVPGPQGSALAIAKVSKEMTAVLTPNQYLHRAVELALPWLSPRDLHQMMRVSCYFRTAALVVASDEAYWLNSVGMPRDRFVEPHKFMAATATKFKTYTSGVAGFLAPLNLSPGPVLPTTRLLFTVAGHRGSGKSTFMQQFCDGELV